MLASLAYPTRVHDWGGQLELALRLLVAVILGSVLGAEREYHHHPAGLRTMALVAGGSCLFSSIGGLIVGGGDPTRIAAQVVTGVGFLGAGAILRGMEDVKGLTTAATIWVAAAIGMAAGFRLYILATVATLIALASLVIVAQLERRMGTRRGE